MTQDRNYLRMMHDCELTHYAKEHGTTELEFVLLERLCTLLDVEEQLETAQDEIRELTASRDHWQAEADMLQAQLEAQ
jgi:hypothetical protein